MRSDFPNGQWSHSPTVVWCPNGVISPIEKSLTSLTFGIQFRFDLYLWALWQNQYRVYTSKSVFPGEWYLFPPDGWVSAGKSPWLFHSLFHVFFGHFMGSWWWQNWRRKHFFEKEKQLKRLRVTPRNLGVKVLTPRTPFNEMRRFHLAARCYSFSSSQVGPLLGKIPVWCCQGS